MLSDPKALTTRLNETHHLAWVIDSIDSFEGDETVRFDMMVRNYANQVYKLFRLYEHGALPEAEWNNTITESKELFQAPGFAAFKQRNNYFLDLWIQMDARELKPTIINSR